MRHYEKAHFHQTPARPYLVILMWRCIGLVMLEIITLLVFKWFCPVTVWARKYSNSARYKFDIYLPDRLAKHNKLICGVMFSLSLLILLVRLLLT